MTLFASIQLEDLERGQSVDELHPSLKKGLNAIEISLMRDGLSENVLEKLRRMDVQRTNLNTRVTEEGDSYVLHVHHGDNAGVVFERLESWISLQAANVEGASRALSPQALLSSATDAHLGVYLMKNEELLMAMYDYVEGNEAALLQLAKDTVAYCDESLAAQSLAVEILKLLPGATEELVAAFSVEMGLATISKLDEEEKDEVTEITDQTRDRLPSGVSLDAAVFVGCKAKLKGLLVSLGLSSELANHLDEDTLNKFYWAIKSNWLSRQDCENLSSANLALAERLLLAWAYDHVLHRSCSTPSSSQGVGSFDLSLVVEPINYVELQRVVVTAQARAEQIFVTAMATSEQRGAEFLATDPYKVIPDQTALGVVISNDAIHVSGGVKELDLTVAILKELCRAYSWHYAEEIRSVAA